MKAEISGGGASDNKGPDLHCDGSLTPPKLFIADKGCDTNRIRETVSQAGGRSVVPVRSNRTNPDMINGFIHALATGSSAASTS